MASPPPENPDAWIQAVARSRDREAFARLFAAFAPSVKRYLLQAGADDARADELVQEVMLTVWRRAETFDPARARASTWIFTIARNKRIDGLRRERLPVAEGGLDAALLASPDRPADLAVAQERKHRALRAALDELPPEQASILAGAYFEDRPLPAIAEEQQVPLGTVKSRVRLALQRLRRALDPEEGS